MKTIQTIIPPNNTKTSNRGQTSFRSILLVLTLLLTFSVSPLVMAQRYLPTDIVAPTGATFTPRALNDFGQVAGSYTPQGARLQPAVWDDGSFSLLPLPPGYVAGIALGLNNVGQIVGLCSTDGTSLGDRACIWENGGVRVLPGFSGTTFSGAVAINDVGTVVGNVFTGTGYNPSTEAVIWKGSTVAKLVPPVSGAQTYAMALDNSGRVAVVWNSGTAYGGGYRARWTPNVPNGMTGTMVSLNTYGSPSLGSVSDINNAGAICGDTWVWYGTEGVPLYHSAWHAFATGINDAGTIVGELELEGFWYLAGVWEAGSNAAQDLNALLAASTPNAYPGSLWSGLAVNNAGQILVAANGGYSLLTPTSASPSLEPPVLQNVWADEQGRISLYWSGLDDSWSYRVKRSTVSGGPYTTIATVTDYVPGFPSNYVYQDNSAVAGVRYYYVVSALDGLKESANSTEGSAIYFLPPAAPSGLIAAVPRKGTTVSLTWKQSTSPSIQSNRIYRSANRGSYVQIAQINPGTSYQDNQTRRRTSYSYIVTAVNANGLESPDSNVATVRTK